METTKPTTLVLADDHAILREGIVDLCRSRPDLKIVGQGSHGDEALEMILELKPDFAVMDLNMPKVGGLDVIRRVRKAKSETSVIVLSISRSASVIRELFTNGANGYVLKNGPAEHLFDAIGHIQAGGQYLTPLLPRELIYKRVQHRDALSSLSRREHEVFSLLVDGMRPKDIAKLLHISPKTVDTYRAGIMRKLEVEGTAGLVRLVIQGNIQMDSPPY
jgi:DNA-binding NarL/FixJ family response regulator